MSVAPLDDATARAFRVPLDKPEADGTLEWNAITVVTATVAAGGEHGLGWTYGPAAAAGVVEELLAPAAIGMSAFDVGRAHLRMRQASRNAPTPGLVSLAISAVDVALWDLKAKLLGVPVARLLGRVHDAVRLYGSGGFTSMTDDELREQVTGWVKTDGVTAVKIKIGEDRGRNEDRDIHRIRLVRDAIGPNVALMVDANGGYDVKQARRVADRTAGDGVVWFEEPVSSDRLADLALLRGAVAPEVAAGEYGTTLEYFRRMCEAGAVDCLQIDASRCGGYTGMLAAASLADGYGLQVSTHCAPHLHVPVAAATPNFRHAEWFADHVMVDGRLFDGIESPIAGAIRPQDARPGHGVSLRDDIDASLRVR